jgi:hypothetical protein
MEDSSMAESNEPTHVTHREFYTALTLVWTFILLAFDTAIFGTTSPTRSTGNVIYLATSLLLVMYYAVLSWRGGGYSRKAVFIAASLAAAALVVGAVAFLMR